MITGKQIRKIAKEELGNRNWQLIPDLTQPVERIRIIVQCKDCKIATWAIFDLREEMCDIGIRDRIKSELVSGFFEEKENQ